MKKAGVRGPGLHDRSAKLQPSEPADQKGNYAPVYNGESWQVNGFAGVWPMMAVARGTFMFKECTFDGTRVDLHAAPYVGCAFRRCELVFDGRPFHLEGNTFDGCTWAFEGTAGATLQMLEILCRNDPNVAQHIAVRLGFVREQVN